MLKYLTPKDLIIPCYNKASEVDVNSVVCCFFLHFCMKCSTLLIMTRFDVVSVMMV